MSGQVTVRLFARLRELAGTDTATVRLPDGATVATLRRTIAEAVPEAAALAAQSAVAVNGEYAAENTPIRPTDEVALIPPVSGGQDP
ncbi:MAG TPA: molybdopterin converting factor subunit 1 [Gemmataceae bacterium]|nr:molybdopterin converting factor subunit 1 [Gemmataceae bacterium]